MNIPKYIDLFRNDLEYKNYSQNTIDNYISQVGLFLRQHQDKYSEPVKIPEREIKSWLMEANSINGRKHRLSALKLFYKFTVKQPMKFKYIEYPKAEKKLPQPLDVSEIQKMIEVCENLKHKAIICTLYSTGIRISELLNLKISNIDSKRGVIYIIQAKGKKDRQVPLDSSLLDLLRRYFQSYKPKEYLFNGQSSLQYSERSVNEVLKSLADKAGIKRRVYAHLMRHCNATHLLEAGTDISIIQKLLGHNSPKTTQIYTQVSTRLISKVNTPLSYIRI